MKKYQNVGRVVGTVQFKDRARFLARGESLTSDEVLVRVSKYIEVTDLEPQKPVVTEVVVVDEPKEVKEKPLVKKKTRKKRVKKTDK